MARVVISCGGSGGWEASVEASSFGEDEEGEREGCEIEVWIVKVCAPREGASCLLRVRVEGS
jgi:hypothetical protein